MKRYAFDKEIPTCLELKGSNLRAIDMRDWSHRWTIPYQDQAEAFIGLCEQEDLCHERTDEWRKSSNVVITGRYTEDRDVLKAARLLLRGSQMMLADEKFSQAAQDAAFVECLDRRDRVGS